MRRLDELRHQGFPVPGPLRRRRCPAAPADSAARGLRADLQPAADHRGYLALGAQLFLLLYPDLRPRRDRARLHRPGLRDGDLGRSVGHLERRRSEEHTSELQSLMRISYAVFCLKKKTKKNKQTVREYITKI